MKKHYFKRNKRLSLHHKRKRNIIKRIFALLFIGIAIVLCVIAYILYNKPNNQNPKKKSITIKEEKREWKEPKNIEKEEVHESNEDMPQEELELVNESYTTRMTSYWANDGYGTGECTGSGLCSWDFGINDKGWYTYDGKLVVATATTYLANQGWYVADGVHLYKYWEELILTIDGIEYEAIILDSCGSSMKTDRVDLFVSNGYNARDTMIEVRRK